MGSATSPRLRSARETSGVSYFAQAAREARSENTCAATANFPALRSYISDAWSLWPLSAPRLRSPEPSISRRRKTRSKCICIPAPMPHGHDLTDFLYADELQDP